MAAFEKEGRTSSSKLIAGRNPKHSVRDRRASARIFSKDHKIPLPKITAVINDHLDNSGSTKSVNLGISQSRIGD